ncbi:hypothetical protein V1227_26000 [Lentzea sp. DG1S-22]|uniref:hypothetical protein n=1 Tax=Lentzea sp. DG1S-22 TaxID=3108822 RepID=UPI002E764BD6|nr:hypothetical protein [Lentzea sp. DG1S-22]WVH78512.1 hypothetical protein V1227_26000 [Lentzea sp. DG1S-22]
MTTDDHRDEERREDQVPDQAAQDEGAAGFGREDVEHASTIAQPVERGRLNAESRV